MRCSIIFCPSVWNLMAELFYINVIPYNPSSSVNYVASIPRLRAITMLNSLKWFSRSLDSNTLHVMVINTADTNFRKTLSFLLLINNFCILTCSICLKLHCIWGLAGAFPLQQAASRQWDVCFWTSAWGSVLLKTKGSQWPSGSAWYYRLQAPSPHLRDSAPEEWTSMATAEGFKYWMDSLIKSYWIFWIVLSISKDTTDKWSEEDCHSVKVVICQTTDRKKLIQIYILQFLFLQFSYCSSSTIS